MNENTRFDRHRAQSVKIIDERCTGCAASRFGVIDKKLQCAATLYEIAPH